MTKRKRQNTNVDGAKGEKYLASPQRREFMLKLAARLNSTIEFDAKDPSRQGDAEDHSYSLTAARPPLFRGWTG